jgi:quercetin dioxygenase-like cupin family protein
MHDLEMRLRSFVVAACAALCIVAGVAVHSAEPDPTVMRFKLPADLVWVASAQNPGLQRAILYGDPEQPGPYALVNRFPPNTFSRPHSHPHDRFIVVISGTWWVGTGGKFDPESTKPLPAGSFAQHYAGRVHYDGAKAEGCEVLIYGEGPATSTPAAAPAAPAAKAPL